MDPHDALNDAAKDLSWHRYRLISDASTDVVYETDTEGVIQWISPSVRDLLGWEPAQLQGRAAHDLIHPVDLERIDALRQSFYRDGEPHTDVTCMVSTAAGGYREVTLGTRPLLGANNVVTGAIVTVADTHDRDSALRALATLSQANRDLVRSADEAELLQRMCNTVVRAGRYLFAWYGRPLHDAEQTVAPVAVAGNHRGYLDEVHVSWGDNPFGRGPSGRCIRTRQTQVENDFAPDPDYQPWLGAATRRGFRSSIVLPVIVGGDLDGVLMVYAAEAGAFDVLAQGLLEDLAADLGYGIERLRGVAELVETTRVAQEQRQRLQATLDSQFDPFVLLEGVRDDTGILVDLRYVEANAAAVAYNQIPRDRLIGARLLDLFPGQLEHGPLRQYFAAIESGEPVILDDYAYGHEILDEERRYDIRAMKSGDAIALTWRDVTERHLAARHLADSERRFRLLAENSSDVILLADPHMRMSWVSPAAGQTLGWEPEQLVGHTATEFIHPDDLPELTNAVSRSTLTHETIRPRYRWRRPDGTYRWMEAAGQPIDDDGTGHAGRVVALRDIDAEVTAKGDLAAREERYRLLAENASDVVWQVAPDGTLSWVSPSVERVLGWQPQAILGAVGMNLVHAEDRGRAMANREEVLLGRQFEGEYRVMCSDGTSRWMALAVHPVQTSTGLNRIVALRDVQDEVAARQRLEFALGHDQLTGLATRRAVLERMAFLQGSLSRWHVVGVLCVGIDALSEINEALTHAAGDVVLTTLAARLVAAAGHPDLVGRGSGDEFLVLLPDLANGADAGQEAERIRRAAHGAVTVTASERQVFPTVSIAIATGGQGVAPEQLLRDASLALRKAKNGGRDRCEFADPGLAVEAEHRLSLESELRDALASGQIVPWFQPLVSLETGELTGYEALARWVRPSGVVLPDVFIPIAERTSLIHEIDLTILRQSLDVLVRLPESFSVSVNVTSSTLARTRYADLVIAACTEAGVSLPRLHLEVTETMLLDPTEDVTEVIQRLSAAGVSWYIDDFGTGYASISSLRDLPMAGLKLDRSFTHGIAHNDTTSMQLAQALVGLAEGLQLDTVAEGVETQEQADYLRALGWRHGQGWLYGKAQPLP